MSGGETLTEAGRTQVEAAARRHDLPPDAVATLLSALHRGGGRQAQFSHPALGGMGQWSRGGGIMISDMFNHALKAKVEQVCAELAASLAETRLFASGTTSDGSGWWPPELGQPSSTGSQNGHGYACFPEARRVALRDAGGISLYDTGEHRITGVSQQQGSTRDLTFTSQHGPVRLADMHRMGAGSSPAAAGAGPSTLEHRDTTERVGEASTHEASHAGHDVLGLLERLHDLHGKGVLTDAEFADKKKDLLARL